MVLQYCETCLRKNQVEMDHISGRYNGAKNVTKLAFFGELILDTSTITICFFCRDLKLFTLIMKSHKYIIIIDKYI